MTFDWLCRNEIFDNQSINELFYLANNARWSNALAKISNFDVNKSPSSITNRHRLLKKVGEQAKEGCQEVDKSVSFDILD
jgi:hypothetical protein